MSEIKDGGPAFPSREEWTEFSEGKEQYATKSGTTRGLSLRDYFAAKAMQAYIAVGPKESASFNNSSLAALNAYRVADAMLKAREQS